MRIAQCVSSQIGCAMGCTFCSTGTMGFVRNMTAGEILSEVLVARMRLGDNRIDHPIIRNLVFMGMGEPLLNLREVTRALEMLNHDKGMDFSPRRITVSTCRIKSGLRELGDSGLAFLAVSLHAPNQELRAQIMPKAANWHLDDLMATLESYPLKTREHITFEYLLLGGVNDQPEHARELAKLVSRVKGKAQPHRLQPRRRSFTRPHRGRHPRLRKIPLVQGRYRHPPQEQGAGHQGRLRPVEKRLGKRKRESKIEEGKGDLSGERSPPSPSKPPLPLPRLSYGSTGDGGNAPARFGGARLRGTRRKTQGPHC